MKPTLVILAAGMGSRYGGLKQMDAMGPSGETVMDYSVFDAIRAGFGKVIFIIREDFAEQFKSHICSQFDDKIEVEYAYQKLDDLPDGFTVPEGREKPWGTTHAILAARKLIKEPFALINADDFYGCDGYVKVAQALKNLHASAQKEQYVIVAYKLANTLSAHGSVNRGVCTEKHGFLEKVEEHLEILAEDNSCTGTDLSGERVELNLETPVSMNLWGFPVSILAHLESHFIDFLETKGSELKSECYIPTVVDELIQGETAECHLVSSESQWFGVTYPEDKQSVVESIRDLIEAGEYPSKLWG